MQVRVFGPNLSSEAQRKGQFHVHTADCADCSHYGPGRKFSGDSGETLEFTSLRDLTVDFYPPEDFDYDEELEWSFYPEDFWLAPCMGGKK